MLPEYQKMKSFGLDMQLHGFYSYNSLNKVILMQGVGQFIETE